MPAPITTTTGVRERPARTPAPLFALRLDEACQALGHLRKARAIADLAHTVERTAGAGWDLGYQRCHCWRGAGHREGCPEAYS